MVKAANEKKKMFSIISGTFKKKLPSFTKKPIHGLLILGRDIVRYELSLHAYAMAYMTIFSLVPSLAAILAVTSFFTPLLGEDSAPFTYAQDLVLTHLTAGSGEQVIEYIEKFIANLDLKKIGLTGFAGMLITLILLLRKVEVALNRIFEIKKARNIITRSIYFWTFLTLGTFCSTLTFGIISGFDIKGLHVESISTWTNLIPSILIFLFFTLLYKIVPNTFISLKHAAIGSLCSSILLNLAGSLFTIYTKQFTNYAVVYGTLAAIPSFLIWIYILWMITLLGAVITWRAREGFEIEEDMDNHHSDIAVNEKLRNYHIHTIIPIILIATIFDRFSIGNRSGIKGYELSSKLNLPTHWVKEGLEILTAMNLVVTQEVSPEENEIMLLAYYPASPPQTLSLKEMKKILNNDYKVWLDNWHHEWPLDLRKLCHEILESDKPNIDLHTFEHLIERLKQAQA